MRGQKAHLYKNQVVTQISIYRENFFWSTTFSVLSAKLAPVADINRETKEKNFMKLKKFHVVKNEKFILFFLLSGNI